MAPFIQHSIKGKSIGAKSRLIVPWDSRWGKGWLQKARMREWFGVTELSCILIAVAATWLGICQNSWNYIPEWVCFYVSNFFKKFKTALKKKKHTL